MSEFVSTNSPSPNGAIGQRDPRGRFALGNSGGPGNPSAKKVAALRRALLSALKPSDLREIIGGMVAAAKSGDTQAARILLSYAVGLPRTEIELWAVGQPHEVPQLNIIIDAPRLEPQ